MNKLPTKALLMLNDNRIYPIIRIFFETQDVTLEQKHNVWNTVSFKDVEFLQ